MLGSFALGPLKSMNHIVLYRKRSHETSPRILFISYIRTKDQFTHIFKELKKNLIQQIYVLIKGLMFIRLSVYLKEEKLKTKIVLKKDF